ncbi:hypothetical protein GCM10009780_69120 [Actinomadura alba]
MRVRGNRIIGVAFLATAAALLVAASGVLTVAGVKDWRCLTAAGVVAPVATLFAGTCKPIGNSRPEARDARPRVVQRNVHTGWEATAGAEDKRSDYNKIAFCPSPKILQRHRRGRT